MTLRDLSPVKRRKTSGNPINSLEALTSYKDNYVLLFLHKTHYKSY